MDTEIAMYLTAIEDSLEMVIESIDGLDGEAVRWKPVESANSLAVIAKHSLANAHRNVLAHFAGEPYDYHRDSEFVAGNETAESFADAFRAIKERFQRALEPMPHSSLDAPCDHARMGRVSGRTVLLQAARHAAEHAGEARLTRQLLLARDFVTD